MNKFGLKPGGDNGTYFQNFPLLVTEEIEPVQVELIDPVKGRKKYFYDDDFTLFTNSGSGEFTSEIAFIGVGISEPDRGWDDIKGMDLKDKVLIVYRVSPLDGKNWSTEVLRNYKMKLARKLGAKAVLVYQQETPIQGGAIQEHSYQPDIPGLYISKQVLRDILKGEKINVDNLLNDCRREPTAFKIKNKKMYFNVNLKKSSNGVGRNVIGIYHGSDPVLKDEYIVVGGHMDHVGSSASGITYYGADDNASGTGVVMELGRSLVLNNIKTKRSVIFIGFGAEEQGLIGSNFFVNHPTVPKEKIVAMMNFDMVGNGDGGVGVGAAEQFPGIWENIENNLDTEEIKNTRTFMSTGEGRGGSDNYPFMQNHIPAIGFYSSGRHPFYHKPEDDFDLINPVSIQNVGDIALKFLLGIADYDQGLEDGFRNYRYLFYTRFQVDFSNKEIDINDKMFSEYWNRGINGILYPVKLLDINDSGMKTSLFMNNITKGINSTGKISLLEGNSRLSSIAGRNNLAVILCSEETDIFNNNPDLLDIYAKLGLKAVMFNMTDRNVFDAGELTGFGRKLISHSKKANVFLFYNYRGREKLSTIFDGLNHIPFIITSENNLLNLDKGELDFLIEKRSKLIISVNGTKTKELSDLIKDINGELVKLDMSNLPKEDVFSILKSIHENGITYEKLMQLLNMNIF
ncbi:M28 family peptidase [candidate division KSB1 bacterium]